MAPLPVLRSVQAAVATVPCDGPWEDQRMTLSEALAGYTAEGAFAEFTEGWKGRLAPGMAADVTVMDRDLAAVPPARLGEAAPAATIMGGRVTHRA